MAGLAHRFRLKAGLPKGFFGRSLLIVVAPVVLMQTVVTYIFFERHWDTVTRRLSRAVASDVAFLTETYNTMPTGVSFDTVGRRALRTIELNALFFPEVTAPSSPRLPLFLVPEKSLENELRKRISQPFWFEATDNDEYVDIWVQLDGGALRIRTPRNRVTSQTAHIFILWMLGTSLVLLAIAIVFLRNQVRPIAALAEAAEAFGKGRDIPDFKPAGATEVRRAATAFMDMRDRIQRQIEQRTAMLAGVSHDLRTPLTRMKLQLAMLPESDEKGDLNGDLNEMQRMLDEYLAFARGQGAEGEAEIDVGLLVEEIAEDSARYGVPVSTRISGDLVLPARRVALKRCLVNLVDNARAYGRRVEIGAQRLGDTVEITVDDDGPGLDEAMYEEAFRPFQRLDESRNQDRAGVGLGLAVARDVARSHGGDISLSRAPLGGLRACVRLPV